MIAREATTQFKDQNDYSPCNDLGSFDEKQLISAEMFESTVKQEILNEILEFENNHYDILRVYWEWQDTLAICKYRLKKIQDAKEALLEKQGKNVWDDISDGDEI